MEDQTLKKYQPKKKYIKAQNFEKYYVTGAIGGFRNPYDFRLSFVNIDTNSLIIKNNELLEQNLNKDDIEKRMSEQLLTVELQCELIMTKRAVVELHNFLGKELKQLKKIEKIETEL